MNRGIIKNTEGLCIQPKDVATKKHFYGSFENYEAEVAANYIVRLCQERKGWYPFTENEIEALYNRFGHQRLSLVSLVDNGYIIEEEGKYHITLDFVLRCYKSSPA